MILFNSFLPTEYLEIIIETSRRYRCLRDDGDFEDDTIWKTEKTMGSVSGVDIISALKEFINYWVGNIHIYN